jgi:coiled-coil domain-containing protein 115
VSEKTQEYVQAASRDPLNWFGILVPPALRKAQGSFKSALEEIVPAMATVTVQMRQIEIEVRRTRKRILKAG